MRATNRTWDEMTNQERAEMCEKIAESYPENHREKIKILKQAKELRKNY